MRLPRYHRLHPMSITIGGRTELSVGEPRFRRDVWRGSSVQYLLLICLFLREVWLAALAEGGAEVSDRCLFNARNSWQVLHGTHIFPLSQVQFVRLREYGHLHRGVLLFRIGE
jgi:hypothetical protein